MIRRILTVPRYESEDENFRAKFSNAFGFTLLALLVVALIPQLIKSTADYTWIVLLGLIAVTIISLYLTRTRRLNLSAILLVMLTWSGITFQAITAEGVRDVIVVGYVAVSLLASILLSWRIGGVLMLLSIGTLWILVLLQASAWITPQPQPPGAYARDLTIIFLVIATLIYFSTTSLRDAIQRANESESALLASNKVLQDLNLNLEERVARRTLELETANRRNERRARQFEAIAQFTRATTSNQELQSLLPSLAVLISEQFGFYHTGIFLIDEQREYAVLTAANSAGGKRMLQRNHRLRMGQTGIVGVVSATGMPRIALDVGVDAAFFDNPDLPETRSEMALPIRTAEHVIGVLDVQSTEANAFQPEDIEVLSTLADQVAIAIQNSRSFELTQELLQQAERMSGAYLRDAWKALQSQAMRVGYMISGSTLKPLNQPIVSPQTGQAMTGKQVVAESGVQPVLAIPIRLRDEVIGAVDIRMPQEHDWDPDEIDIAEAVADRLSLAIETLLLIESTQRRAEIERVTSDISGKISSTTQFEAILRTAAEELSRALGGSDVIVQLQAPELSTEAD